VTGCAVEAVLPVLEVDDDVLLPDGTVDGAGTLGTSTAALLPVLLVTGAVVVEAVAAGAVLVALSVEDEVSGTSTEGAAGAAVPSLAAVPSPAVAAAGGGGVIGSSGGGRSCSVVVCDLSVWLSMAESMPWT
jgi:hypothetical protein